MRALLLSLLVLAFGAPALAQPKVEGFTLALPDGFKMANQSRNATMFVIQWLPEGETADNWSEMITVFSMKNKPSSIQDYVDEMIEHYAACATHEATKRKEGLTNGYPYALWSFVCGDAPDTHKSEYVYMKLIYGADYFFVVQDAYRDVPSPRIDGDADVFMMDVSACDPRTPDHPCP